MNFAEHDTPAETPEDIGLQDALGRLTTRSSILNALQLIIDAHSLVSVTDYAGRIIYANDRLCEVSQYTRDELIGQQRSILRSEYHPESFFEELWSTVRSGQVWTGDIQNQAKDGSFFWLQSTVSPIFDEKNQIVGFAGIQTDVTAQRQLMESTLVAAKLETGGPTIRIEACNIGSTLSEICDRQQDIAQNHNISCTVSELPETIQADIAAVEQIFTNLLSNAVKYAENATEIKVAGHVEEHDVVIRVRDYGVGIDEDDMPNMFQRFFRARTSMGIAGTGIGLNLVKTLVELHNGSITVESKKGEGSMFIVRLPIAGPATTKETEGQAA